MIRCSCGQEFEAGTGIAYRRLREFFESIGGTFSDAIPNGRGVKYEMTLHGRTATVEVPNHNVNALDQFYVPSVPDPQTFHDFKGDLVPDVFWRLVQAAFWQSSAKM